MLSCLALVLFLLTTHGSSAPELLDFVAIDQDKPRLFKWHYGYITMLQKVASAFPEQALSPTYPFLEAQLLRQQTIINSHQSTPGKIGYTNFRQTSCSLKSLAMWSHARKAVHFKLRTSVLSLCHRLQLNVKLNLANKRIIRLCVSSDR